MATIKEQIKGSLWVEKYRPTALEQMAIPADYREQFTSYIEKGTIPHLLLLGGAGSGKTTIAKILMSKIACDTMIMNASDERGIDTIRGKVKSEAQMASLNPLKIILLDEADHITNDAQASLRNLMEQYSARTRFILTGNYENRIIDPLKSRCQTFTFNAYPKEDMHKVLVNILEQEKLKYTNEDLHKHIEVYYPDLRRAINMMQRNIQSGSFVFKDNKDEHAAILSALLSKSLKAIRQELANTPPDYTELYQYIYDHIGEFPAKADKAKILIDCAEHEWRGNNLASAEMNFAAFALKAIKALG